jgi:hypothetical protein
MRSIDSKRILIFQQRGWGVSIGLRLAEKLQERGCKLAALTIKKSTHRIISNSSTNYEMIFNADKVKENPKEYIADSKLSLIDVCKGLGISSIWELVQASRYHVKSYRDKYYFGFSQNISDNEIKQYVIAIYKYIDYICNEFSPDFIVTPNFAGLQHIMFNLYAKKNGIVMLGCIDSKVPGIFIFTTSYLGDSGRFFEHFKMLSEGKAVSQYKDSEKDLIKLYSDIISQSSKPKAITSNVSKRLYSKLKLELIPFVLLVLFFFRKRKNKLKNQKATLDDKTPYFILRDYFQEKINSWNANKHTSNNIDGVENYIYLPLQVQPEATIDIHSTRFNNQIETARQVAMSLPDNDVLIVKDHPSMRSKRSSSYLRKISRLPNVILANGSISSTSLIKKANMVIAPGGTTIFESVLLSKKIIQLGNLGTTKCLPGVYHHSNLITLSKKIRDIYDIIEDDEKSRKMLLNYISAANDVGFQLQYQEIADSVKKPTKIELDSICNRFIEEIENFV